MNAYELVNGLNQLLNLADAIDNAGAGAKALTRGQYSTRQACRLELSQFLLYIANGNGNLTEGEMALVNIVLGEEYTAYQLRQLASAISVPDPSSSMTLMGFLSGDALLTQQNGYRTTSSSDALISAFESFGNLIVAFDENPVSKTRCMNYIRGMKSYVLKTL